LKHLLISAGLRYNYVQVRAKDTTFGDLKITPTALVGQVGLMYQIKNAHHLGFTINNAFRAPNINDISSFGSFDYGIEVPSMDLAPEKSFTFEANYKITLSKIRLALALYHTQLFDLITRIRATYNGSDIYDGENVYKKQNTAKAYIQGLEVEAEWALLSNLQLRTYLIHTYGQNITADEAMRRIPPLNGRIALRYGILLHWIELESVFAAKQDRLSNDDIDDHRIADGGTPGWWVMNIRGGYQIGPWGFFAGLINLFNEAYRIHGSGVDGYGRSAYLQVGFSW
jgi:outer membrane receptor protein involved in Fe transport